jgi:hypothetical protein
MIRALVPVECPNRVAVSAVTSTFVGVTIVAAITTVTNAVLAVSRLVAYLRDPFRGLRRLHKPVPGRIPVLVERLHPPPRDVLGRRGLVAG